MSIQVEELYSSNILSITDVRCRAHSVHRSAEEHSPTNDVVFPRRGCFVRHLGRFEAVADANTVHFFRMHEPYRISHPVSGGDDCTCLSFAPDVLVDAFGAYDPSVADHPDDPLRAARTLSPTTMFAGLHHLRRITLEPQFYTDGSSALLVDEIALRLLETVARAGTQTKIPSKRRLRAGTNNAHRELAEHARVVLSTYMCDALTLPRIARCVLSSPFHLARIFRQMTGLSLHQYQCRLRLRAALERLADGESDLTALALSLGFASHSHFSDAFRREFGLTPSAVRRGPRPNHFREMSTNLKASPPCPKYA